MCMINHGSFSVSLVTVKAKYLGEDPSVMIIIAVNLFQEDSEIILMRV